ncbi:receptor-type tyrosine-protein phosphatase H-like [Megalobrama amblycephala]|uniref:receptor-type tyrosine-protein phosphatase H-like n=1 Tax=Megalobrama amblycephala TaxID=75352 RepID=UPI0020140963|nr:receptor-type tyrosine-protein phosphatase H-like [Megalobrama amblycephala]
MQPHLYPTDTTKIAFIISQLQGKALQWADSLWTHKGSVVKSYSSFVAHFREVFGTPLADSSIGEKLYNLKQGSNSVTDYALQFRTLAASSGWNEQALITSFRQGLEPRKADPESMSILWISGACNLRMPNSSSSTFGSAGNFISGSLCRQRKLKTSPSPTIYQVQSITGKPLSRKRISCCVGPLQLRVGILHVEDIHLLVLEDSTADVVLGCPWLEQHSPTISWHTGEILKWGEHCFSSCFSELPVPKSPCSKKISVCTTSIESPIKKRSTDIPSCYAPFSDVFCPQRASKLPPHWLWDCAIDLLPGEPVPRGRIYPLSVPEEKAMEEYIEEALNQGYIRLSTSPAASSFFLVAKKDGGLRPCIDYRSLNKITVKFRLAEHRHHVAEVLLRLQQYHLFLKAEKCSFHQPSVHFLGYFIDHSGIRMDEGKVEAIKSWPAPTTIKELQRFLGFTNFYRRFIKNYSSIVHPLTNLLRHQPKFDFTISYRPGSKNIKADALSRLHAPEEKNESPETILPKSIFVNPIQWSEETLPSSNASSYTPPGCPQGLQRPYQHRRPSMSQPDPFQALVDALRRTLTTNPPSPSPATSPSPAPAGTSVSTVSSPSPPLTLAAVSGWNEQALITTYRQGLEPRACLQEHQDQFLPTMLLCRSEPVSSPEPANEPMDVENSCLTPSERHRQLTLNLCLYCGASGHAIAACPTRPPRPMEKVKFPSLSSSVPSNVESVFVIDRKETEMTFEWIKVNNRNGYTYKLEFIDKIESIPTTSGSAVVYRVTPLPSGTEVFFTLYTVFEGVKSSGFSFSNITVPSNVGSVSVIDRKETEMTFQWERVNNRNDYTYELVYGDKIETIATQPDSLVVYRVESLSSGIEYSFTLSTVFKDLQSSGYKFASINALSDVTEVGVDRSLTQLTIKWNKLNKNDIYNYTLRDSHGTENNFTGSVMGDEIIHIYSHLTPGTIHSFTLFTVVNGVRSNGYSFKSITTINCESFNWTVTNSSIVAQVNGSTRVIAENSTGNSKNDPVVDNRVNLQELYPGAIYTVSLWYDLDSEGLLQCSHLLTLDPNSVLNLQCKYFSGGYGLAVIWDHPYGVMDVVQVDIGSQSFNRSSKESPRQEFKNLQVAHWYKVTATSFSGAKKSKMESLNCQTDPAGVIAGVLVFFLLVILICAAVYWWLRSGSAKRNKSPKPVELKVTNKSYKLIPVDTFPEHFRNMSRDENRGFSQEHEDLSSVGIEQSSVAAYLPKNKDKNRFTNILPYDSSRVQLTVNDEDDSDYINANYMPGYDNASKQYIAAQGPLPSTVNGFWRMVWENRSQAIVMVTNCTESGRIKCEQYWPLDYTPCVYGNLVVTVKSENKAPSWTLREFSVKNKSTSETRTVKHFHFTAWPDHGVPSGTEELIQFRGLVRQHIESSFSAGPTVVHCSAGVGQTGTLIALDVLLQQLDREKAVGIAAFVQQMRLCRPLMVQTESQYVFLHQCIMDSLQPKFVANSEPLYENSDVIYVNAIALRQYENVKYEQK